MEKEEYKNASEVICIIDRSRSMYGKEKEIIESFNSWLAHQKQMKKEMLVTLALCNEECELIYSRMPLKYVKPLDSFTYYTKGYSAYRDSAQEVLNLISDLMSPRLEAGRQQEVSLYMITDGLDNASSREESDEFQQRLELLKKRGWKIYISNRRIRENSAISMV